MRRLVKHRSSRGHARIGAARRRVACTRRHRRSSGTRCFLNALESGFSRCASRRTHHGRSDARRVDARVRGEPTLSTRFIHSSERTLTALRSARFVRAQFARRTVRFARLQRPRGRGSGPLSHVPRCSYSTRFRAKAGGSRRVRCGPLAAGVSFRTRVPRWRDGCNGEGAATAVVAAAAATSVFEAVATEPPCTAPEHR